MQIDGQQVLMLFIAVVSTVLAVTLPKWYVKLPLFIVALGSSLTFAGLITADPNFVLAFEALLFLLTGISSLRVKGLGNFILGVILGFLGGVLFILALNAFGAVPGTFLGGLAESIGRGIQEFLNTIRLAITGTT